ncbi:hypothetical protein PJN38_24350 [Mycobacterium kansasii]
MTTTTDTALHLAYCSACDCARWVSDAAAVDRWMHCHPHNEAAA